MSESWEPTLAPPLRPLKDSRGFPVGLTIAVAIALSILIGLGAWQMQRKVWKEALLAQIAALQNAPARPIAPVLQDLANGHSVDYTRVSIDCPGLAAAPFVQIYGLKDGQAGWRLISACATPAGPYGAVLVDRGFVADAGGRPPVDRSQMQPLSIVGVLRTPDHASFVTPPNDAAANRWFSHDLPAMARALSAPKPAPILLFAETPTNPGFAPLVPAPIPTNIPNRHFEYALTWFGLAGALAGVYAAMLFRRRKT